MVMNQPGFSLSYITRLDAVQYTKIMLGEMELNAAETVCVSKAESFGDKVKSFVAQVK